MSGKGGRGIVPPHVLSAIAEEGSPEERRWTREDLETNARFREGRTAKPKTGTSGMRDRDDGNGDVGDRGGTP